MKSSSNLFFDITTFPEITIICHLLLQNMYVWRWVSTCLLAWFNQVWLIPLHNIESFIRHYETCTIAHCTR